MSKLDLHEVLSNNLLFKMPKKDKLIQ